MKKIKCILTFLVVIAGLISVTVAFAAISAHKSFNTITYYYNGTKNVKISPDFSNSLVESEVTDQKMWGVSGSVVSGKGDYLLGISFDNSQSSLQQVIIALWSYYITNSYSLPPNSVTVTIKGVEIIIIIHRKAT